jgi:hypothetical protein
MNFSSYHLPKTPTVFASIASKHTDLLRDTPSSRLSRQQLCTSGMCDNSGSEFVRIREPARCQTTHTCKRPLVQKWLHVQVGRKGGPILECTHACELVGIIITIVFWKDIQVSGNNNKQNVATGLCGASAEPVRSQCESNP